MKYLKIHIFLCWLLVLLYTIVDGALWFAGYILYIIWTFKLVPLSEAWKQMHTRPEELVNIYGYYSDDNIIQSFNRRWEDVKSVFKI